ncbi:MAG: hypothetical protein JWL62_2001, partial [Hyphomicrobiales bacterium]|nr:hypothetical protein [Hyphomicrobiales bacterium]
MRTILRRGLALCLIAPLVPGNARADDFYRGKTINVVVG